jgi:hypothetical protein
MWIFPSYGNDAKRIVFAQRRLPCSPTHSPAATSGGISSETLTLTSLHTFDLITITVYLLVTLLIGLSFAKPWRGAASRGP